MICLSQESQKCSKYTIAASFNKRPRRNSAKWLRILNFKTFLDRANLSKVRKKILCFFHETQLSGKSVQTSTWSSGLVYYWSQLFQRWMALLTGQWFIRWIALSSFWTTGAWIGLFGSAWLFNNLCGSQHLCQEQCKLHIVSSLRIPTCC